MHRHKGKGQPVAMYSTPLYNTFTKHCSPTLKLTVRRQAFLWLQPYGIQRQETEGSASNFMDEESFAGGYLGINAVSRLVSHFYKVVWLLT